MSSVTIEGGSLDEVSQHFDAIHSKFLSTYFNLDQAKKRLADATQQLDGLDRDLKKLLAQAKDPHDPALAAAQENYHRAVDKLNQGGLQKAVSDLTPDEQTARDAAIVAGWSYLHKATKVLERFSRMSDADPQKPERLNTVLVRAAIVLGELAKLESMPRTTLPELPLPDPSQASKISSREIERLLEVEREMTGLVKSCEQEVSDSEQDEKRLMTLEAEADPTLQERVRGMLNPVRQRITFLQQMSEQASHRRAAYRQEAEKLTKRRRELEDQQAAKDQSIKDQSATSNKP